MAELSHYLELYQPHVVCLQETWLNASVEEVKIPGYVICSRRDRHQGDNRGGILTIRREDLNGIVHISNTENEERSWHFLKSGIDIILLANWYRPGASTHDGFSALYSEVSEFFPQISGLIIVGDLNIHHQRWLYFSRENTAIGGDMKTFCDFHGLTQLVREPTRNEYLLDLVLTDIGGATVEVTPRIADHKGVLVKLPLSVVNETILRREMWILKNANWKCLSKALSVAILAQASLQQLCAGVQPIGPCLGPLLSRWRLQQWLRIFAAAPGDRVHQRH